MTRDLPIPGAIDEVTPAWLTIALRSIGVLADGAVASVVPRPIGDRASYTGEVYRLAVTYDGVATGAPRFLVAKLPTRDAAKREAGQTFRPNEREIRFSRDLTPRLDIPVPACYVAAMDQTTGRTILLLEDLAPAVVLDQRHGCTREQAEVAVDALSRLHRSWHESPVRQPDWLAASPDARAAGRALIERLYSAAWPAFVAQSGNLLTAGARSLGEALLTRLDQVWSRLDELRATLTHGDYRVANMAFGAAPGDRPLAVFDWEDVGPGSGTIDLSWFIVGCLDAPDRRTWETDLLARYRDLSAIDASDEDYRLATLDRFVQSVLTATHLRHGSRGDHAMAQALTQRFVAACSDLRLADLL